MILQWAVQFSFNLKWRREGIHVPIPSQCFVCVCLASLFVLTELCLPVCVFVFSPAFTTQLPAFTPEAPEPSADASQPTFRVRGRGWISECVVFLLWFVFVLFWAPREALSNVGCLSSLLPFPNILPNFSVSLFDLLLHYDFIWRHHILSNVEIIIFTYKF